MKFEIGKFYRSNTNAKVKLAHVFGDGELLFANSLYHFRAAPDGSRAEGEDSCSFIVCEWEDAEHILKMHAPCLLRDLSDMTIFEGPYAHSLDHAKAQVELWNKELESPYELIGWPAYASPHWPKLEVKE